MRRIKFRVWDSDNKKYWYLDGYDILCGERDFCLHSYSEINSRNLNLEQFSGMTDRKGKEVYEGDIICEQMTEENACAGGECNIGKVYFAAGTFMIDGDGPLYEHTYSLTPDILEDYIVIGNIHENPELLEK